jgi:DsbC/DsbD-like thiol-disulfide interchange protein
MTRFLRVLSAAFFILTVFVGVLVAPAHAAAKVAVTSAKISPSSVNQGGTAILTISIDVSSGYHIYAVKQSDPDLIPTSVTVSPVKGLKVGSPVYPEAKKIVVPSSATPLSVYLGSNKVTFPVSVTPAVKRGKYAVPVTVTYQACNASACFPPQTDNLTATLVVK